MDFTIRKGELLMSFWGALPGSATAILFRNCSKKGSRQFFKHCTMKGFALIIVATR